MKYSKVRHDFLSRIAAGEERVGLTNSPTLDALHRERLIEPGFSTALTPEGARVLAAYNAMASKT